MRDRMPVARPLMPRPMLGVVRRPAFSSDCAYWRCPGNDLRLAPERNGAVVPGIGQARDRAVTNDDFDGVLVLSTEARGVALGSFPRAPTAQNVGPRLTDLASPVARSVQAQSRVALRLA